MRKITALATAAGLLIALTACATSAPSGSCTPTATDGDSSILVKATGEFGSDPEATFPKPLVTKKVEVSALDTGKGAIVYPGQYALMQVSLYDAETGGSSGSSGYEEETPFVVKAGDGQSNFGLAVECQTVGSRLVTVLTGSDLVGFQGVTEDSIAANADATFVAVIDIQGSVLGKAYGVPQIPQQGMPSVVTTPEGVPGLTIPGDDAPKKLRIAVLLQGDGAVVAEGDTIYFHFLRVDWDNPDSLKSTWTTDEGLPQEVLVSAIDKTSGAGLTPGLLAAIKGQKVGTQVLAVVPPAFGFPEGLEPTGVDPTGTLVYVIDILGIKSK